MPMPILWFLIALGIVDVVVLAAGAILFLAVWLRRRATPHAWSPYKPEALGGESFLCANCGQWSFNKGTPPQRGCRGEWF